MKRLLNESDLDQHIRETYGLAEPRWDYDAQVYDFLLRDWQPTMPGTPVPADAELGADPLGAGIWLWVLAWVAVGVLAGCLALWALLAA